MAVVGAGCAVGVAPIGEHVARPTPNPTPPTAPVMGSHPRTNWDRVVYETLRHLFFGPPDAVVRVAGRAGDAVDDRLPIGVGLFSRLALAEEPAAHLGPQGLGGSADNRGRR